MSTFAVYFLSTIFGATCYIIMYYYLFFSFSVQKCSVSNLLSLNSETVFFFILN